MQFVPAAISLSPDNKYIVAGDWYGMVRVCEVASGTEVLAIRGHDERVRAVAFSRSVNRIISVDDNGTVGIWRFPRIGLGQAGIISSSLSEVAFSADRRQIAALSEDKLQILNASDGSEIKSFGPSAAFSYENTLYSFNGKHVVGGRRFISRSTGEESKVIKVWDCTTGKEVLNFESEETASVVAFSPDSKYVVSGCRSGLVMWDVAEGTKVKTFNLDQGPGEVTAIAIDPEGKRIVASSGRYSASNAITMWDIATAKEEWKTDTNQPIAVAAFSPDGKRVVSGDEEAGMVKIWNANTGENMTHYYHGGEIIGIAFSPDGRRILSGGPNGIIKIWDANTGAEVLTLDAQVEVMALSFSHDGKMILAGCDDGTIKVWSSGGLGGTENGKEPEKDARQTVR